MEVDDPKTRWSSRKLWTCIVATAVGVTVTLIVPSAATIPFYSFLIAMSTIYLGSNLTEYKLRGPLVTAEAGDDE